MTYDHGGGAYRLPPDAPSSADSANRSSRQNRSGGSTSAERVRLAMLVFVITALILAAQLFRYQAFAGGKNIENETDRIRPDAQMPRGTITDRKGHPLAMDTWSYLILADSTLIPEAKRELTAAKLSPILGIDKDELVRKLTENADSNSVEMNRRGPDLLPLTVAAGEEIASTFTFTITSIALPRRFYPEDTLAAHVLGIVSLRERIGYGGLEEYFHDFLRAKSRVPQLFEAPKPESNTDAANATLPDTPFVPSAVQRDLILTLDRTVQYIAETELKQAIDNYKAESGSIIILEPHTSAVLAMASWPIFNPNAAGQDMASEALVNPAITEFYEPGSVFKVITLAAALSENVIKPETKIEDEAKFIYGQQTIQNSDGKGHGRVDLADVLALSLNVGAAKVATQIGVEKFYRSARRFGFGQLTGVELEGEVAGIVKVPGKGEWYPSDLATNAFGQGISVTPLQMTNAIAAIASGGVLHRPHIVAQIIDGERLITVEPQALSRAVSAEAARTVTNLMVEAVKRTPGAGIEGYAIAAKSGTAEIPGAIGYTDEKTIASYAGFFPPDDPQFVILVKLDRPKTSAWASQTAAPTFRSVARQLIALYSIPPDNIRLGRNPN